VQRLATIAHGDGVCTTCIPSGVSTPLDHPRQGLDHPRQGLDHPRHGLDHPNDKEKA
jgi:hypothetical protein